jgi:hypothetical protein
MFPGREDTYRTDGAILVFEMASPQYPCVATGAQGSKEFRY